jgi:V/A-type H+-transporting ATPase subunit C
MHNIKTFLRLYVLKEPEEKLKSSLVAGGFIKEEIFLRCFSQGLSVLLQRLEFVHKRDQIIDYASFLRDAVKKIEKDNYFVALEKAINDFLIQVLKPAKYLAFGPEPLLAYYLAKVNEINLVRMIILAKLNDVDANLVKERLNYVYA